MQEAGRHRAWRTFKFRIGLGFGLVAACVVALVFVALSESGAGHGAQHASSSGRLVIVATGILAILVAAGAWFGLTREFARGLKTAHTRLSSMATATSERLKPGIEALAAGNLAVHLEGKTKPQTEFEDNEFGDLMQTTEALRDAIIACYSAYNAAVGSLRELISEVATTALSVGDASQQVQATSDETGKATAEVAHAVERVAQGADRQVRMIEAARRAAEEVAGAVAESARQAEQSAEVAARARETAQ